MQSARLPFTIAKNRTDYPADVIYQSDMSVPQITYSEKLLIDYRHFDAFGIQVGHMIIYQPLAECNYLAFIQ